MSDRKIERSPRENASDEFLKLDDAEERASGERKSGRSMKRSSAEHRGGSRAQEVVRRKRRKKKLRRRLVAYGMRAACVLVVILLIAGVKMAMSGKEEKRHNRALPSYITEEYLSINPYSRPGTDVVDVDAVVIHSAERAGGTAMELRDSYEALKDSGEAYQSSNFILGSDGSGLVCVPVGEIAYASNSRNTDSVSIEYCYDTPDGAPSGETYRTMVDLTAWVCGKYHVSRDQILRHGDVSGKMCPSYYVNSSENWEQFLDDVQTQLEEQNWMWPEFLPAAEESSEEES